MVIIEKIKRFIRKYRIIYWTALVFAPFSAYLYGLTSAVRPQPPQIVVDNAKVECNCPECVCAECVCPESKKESAALTVEEENGAVQNGVSAEENGATQNIASYVASKNGGKYYPIDCGYISRIKDENRVYYASKEAAEKDGKEPSSVCAQDGE